MLIAQFYVKKAIPAIKVFDSSTCITSRVKVKHGCILIYHTLLVRVVLTLLIHVCYVCCIDKGSISSAMMMAVQFEIMS